MNPINIIQSTFVPLPIENVDTDQIIPARFLKSSEKEGFGTQLFNDWRYLPDGTPNPDFVLNKSKYSGEILVAGKNFGCGSSREHAAWALAGQGFRAVVSSYFADIFQNNALNNGLLPVQVTQPFLQEIFAQKAESTLTINLYDCWIQIDKTGSRCQFPISSYKQECLLNGFSDIDYLISMESEIEAYEKNTRATA